MASLQPSSRAPAWSGTDDSHQRRSASRSRAALSHSRRRVLRAGIEKQLRGDSAAGVMVAGCGLRVAGCGLRVGIRNEALIWWRASRQINASFRFQNQQPATEIAEAWAPNDDGSRP